MSKEQDIQRAISHDRMRQIPNIWKNILMSTSRYERAKREGTLSHGELQYFQALNGGMYGMMNELIHDEEIVTVLKPEGKVIFQKGPTL